MQRGDTLYRVVNGQLETATFVEEGFVEGASLPTWVLIGHRDRSRIRCSPRMYVDTEQKAWERYLQECKEALPAAQKSVQEAKAHLLHVRTEIVRTSTVLEGLKDAPAKDTDR